MSECIVCFVCDFSTHFIVVSREFFSEFFAFACCCRYKYILAYLPVVVFYYSGKTLFRFSLESSFEDLRDLVANITGVCVCVCVCGSPEPIIIGQTLLSK